MSFSKNEHLYKIVEINISNYFLKTFRMEDKYVIPTLIFLLFSSGVITGCQNENETDNSTSQEVITLKALEDFERLDIEGFVPFYRDEQRGVLAVNSIEYPDEFAAAETKWNWSDATYNITIKTMPEEDGECTYRLFINGELIGEFVNLEVDEAFGNATHTWRGVEIEAGDIIRITSNTHSNGLIPENDGYAWARGRWSELIFIRV
jgi:hypothetical protein